MSEAELVQQRVDALLRESNIFPAAGDKPVTRRQMGLIVAGLVAAQIAIHFFF